MPFDGPMPHDAAPLHALLHVRDLLARPNGWCQGTAYRDKAMCLMQAAAIATYGNIALQQCVVKHLNKELPRWYRHCRGLVAFNDAFSTTQAKVVALVDRAIAHGPHTN